MGTNPANGHYHRPMVRKVVHYIGHVQGVGFRATARHVAGGFAVTGYVRNTADGGVELVAEGEPVEVDRFLAAIAQRLAGHIHHADIHTGPATGEFRGVEIRR